MHKLLIARGNAYITDLRNDTFRRILKMTLWATYALSGYALLFEFLFFNSPRAMPLRERLDLLAGDLLAHLPLWLFAALVLFASALQQRRLAAAKAILVTAMLAAPTADIVLYGQQLQPYLLYLVALIVISIITGYNAVVISCSLVALMLLATLAEATLHQRPLALETLGLCWITTKIALLIGVAGFIYETIFSDSAAWALESQQKDEKRRILLQKKQDELDKTLTQLTFAHSQLETLYSALEEAKNRAEEANVLKTRFLANMSHELRTPLNAIINFTHILSDEELGGLSEEQRAFQSRISFNAEHLLGLINDILDLTKIEAGHMELNFEPLDLDPLLKGLMATAVGLTRAKGLELRLEIPPGLPPVQADKTRVRQVLLNLLSNAAKFTHQGTITVRACACEDGFVQLSVQDTGIGIPPGQEALIFQEFRQVQSEMTREYQGTGLGLPISKQLVELHGGRMWLTSALGAGSTFFFTLPVAPRD